MIVKPVETIILGLVAGVLGGALGQSGAEIMVPGLLLLGIVSNFKTAAGTVLLTILPPLSLMAIFVYWKRNQVQVWTSAILIIFYFFAAWFGAYFTKNVTDQTLEYVSGVYFILIGLFFLWNAYTGTYGQSSSNPHITSVHKEGFRHLLKFFPGNRDK